MPNSQAQVQKTRSANTMVMPITLAMILLAAPITTLTIALALIHQPMAG
ncbi:MAG: hypothetical protein ACI90U_002048 [Pseudomonadales bacterium]|jgi:hypothetical protein